MKMGENSFKWKKSGLLTLSNILLILKHKLEIVKSLIKSSEISPSCFIWRNHVLYSSDTLNLYEKHVSSDQNMYHNLLSAVLKESVVEFNDIAVSGRSSSLQALSHDLPNNPTTYNEFQASETSSLITSTELASSQQQAPTKCFIHCGESVSNYGFEYYCPENRLVLSPTTEACILSVLNTMARFSFPALNGEHGSGKSETAKEVAKILGRHHYQYLCSSMTLLPNLHRLLSGAMKSGSLLILENIISIPFKVMICFGEWLQALSLLITKAVMKKQSCTTLIQLQDSQNEIELVVIDSKSSISPLLFPSDEHHYLITDSSNQALDSQTQSKKMLLSEKCSKGNRTPIRHSLPHVAIQEESSAFLKSSSNAKGVSPVPFHQRDIHSQNSVTEQLLPSRSRNTTRIDWYNMTEGNDSNIQEWSGYGGGPKFELQFNGDLFRVSPAFGCCLTDKLCISKSIEVPEELKVALRTISLKPPSFAYTAEVLLLSCGFNDAYVLSRRLAKFWEHFSHQVSTSSGVPISVDLHSMKLVIKQAAVMIGNESQSQSSTLESAAVVHAVKQWFYPQISHPIEIHDEEEYEETVSTTHVLSNWNKLHQLLDIYFLSSGESGDCESGDCETDIGKETVPAELADAIHSQLTDQHLQTLPSFVNKVKQLHVSLHYSKCVVFSGPAGSGKTKAYNTLAAAYQYIRELQEMRKSSSSKKNTNRYTAENQRCANDYPIVDITIINPSAYSFDELFGAYSVDSEEDTNEHSQWKDGILTRHLRQIMSFDESKYIAPQVDTISQELLDSGSVHWIVLNGSINYTLMEALDHLTSGEGLILFNGEKLILPGSCKILVETSVLSEMSPSFLSHSTLIYFNDGTVPYNAVVDTWLDRSPTRHNLSPLSAETLATMIKQLLPDTLKFLQEMNTNFSCNTYSMWSKSQTYGMTETQCFLNLLSAVLERNAPKVESSVINTRSSRTSSSRLIESRASSAFLTSYSSMPSSVQVDPNSSMTSSRLSMMHNDGEQLDPIADLIDDELSEFNLEVEFGLSMQLQMASMLSFAYIWSLGAFCPFSQLSSFSDFARDLIMQLPYAVPLPEEGSVFDYYLNMKQYQFLPWTERKGNSGSDISTSGYVSLPELERYMYIIDLYLSFGLNVMIIGQKGCGKTSLVENLQSRLPITRIKITSALNPSQLQERILAKVSTFEKRSTQHHTRGTNKASNKCVFFLDDVYSASSASKSSFSYLDCHSTKSSAVLELSRYISTHYQVYDYSRNYQHILNDVRFTTSCSPEEYLRLPIEFSRAFNPVPFLPLSDECLKHIFSRSVSLWVQQFPKSIMENTEGLAEALGTASVTVLRSLTAKCYPSPSNPQLLFTLHDLMHIYEGLLLLSPDTKAQSQPQLNLLNRRGFLSSTQSSKAPRSRSLSKQMTRSQKKQSIFVASNDKSQLKVRRRGITPNLDQLEQAGVLSTLRTIIRLWCHETTRVFLDRIVDSKDRIWFTKLLEVCIKYCFCGDHLKKPANSLTQQRHFGGTASYGIRRTRGGRSLQSSLEEPNLEDLLKSDIKVDVMERLMPADSHTQSDSGLKKLIAFDQVTMKGEDLTAILFADFPSAVAINSSGSTSPSSTHSSEMISKDIVSSSNVTSSYSEHGDGQAMDLLYKHVDSFTRENRGSRSSFGLVFFKGAIEHASRICRVLNLPGCHALLIGTNGSGRRTLVRFLSHTFKSKLFELSSNSDDGSEYEIVLKTLRNVCISAAVDSTTTVLLIRSKNLLDSQAWEMIFQIMEEGLCPGLFTTSELLVISNKLQKGRVKKTMQGARQTFAKAVCRNLHVFVLWDVNCKTGSIFSFQQDYSHDRTQSGGRRKISVHETEKNLRTIFSSLCQACSYIDHYQGWTKQAYTDIALQWWQHKNSDKESSCIKWQDWIDTSSQLEAVGMLVTHVHLTTTKVLIQTYGTHGNQLVSPNIFLECLRMAQELALKLKTKEQVVADRIQSALKKLAEVDSVVCELEHKLTELRPKLITVEQEVRQRMNEITAAREKYMIANQKCKDADATIKTESKTVQHLTEIVDTKLNEVSPVYHSALTALSSVEKNDVLEIMRYRFPPATLTPVFDALCMLFDREQTWEDCKQLLQSQKFFESLMFFDKDNVPLKKLRCLEKIIEESSKFELLSHGSQAVVSLCMWLNALVEYHLAKMAVQPFKEQLVKAENTLMDARKIYIEMRQYMMETKTDLEGTVKLHKESVQNQKAIEAEVEDVSTKLDNARHLLITLAKQRQKWKDKVTLTQSRIDSLPGHALLCSAAVCYLTRVPPSKHEDLLSSWLGYCEGTISLGNIIEDHGGLQAAKGYQARSGQQQVVKIQKDFTVSAQMSEQKEQSLWKQENLFPDQSTQDRCLASRYCCTLESVYWPLIFDPHGHFKMYFDAMQYKCDQVTSRVSHNLQHLQSALKQDDPPSIISVDVADNSFIEKIIAAMTTGSTVLLSLGTDLSTPLPQEKRELLSKILAKNFNDAKHHHLVLSLDSFPLITIHSDFKLYVIIKRSLEDFIKFQEDRPLRLLKLSCNDLSSFFVIDLGLSIEGFQNYLQKLIIKYKRPEYSIRYRSLLVDLTLHQQHLDHNEENIDSCIIDSIGSILDESQLLKSVEISVSSDASILELITETMKNLRAFDQQVQVYKALSGYATMLFRCVQRLSNCFKYFKFPLDCFEAILSDVLTSSSKDIKVPNNLMAINAHILHLKHEVLLSVFESLKIYLFERHQILLLLLFGLETMKQQGKLSDEETNLLAESLLTAESHLQLLSPEGNSSSGIQGDSQKPSWITEEYWCGVLQLQKRLPFFRRLSIEVCSFTQEWIEYFQMAPSLLSPVPGYGDSCSIGQKLLLWKVFKQCMFSEVVMDFILHILGTDFISTHVNTVSNIFSHSKPSVAVICYLSNAATFTTCLKMVSSHMEVEVHSIALIDQFHLTGLLVQLPDLMQKACWLIIEHCYMCSDLPAMLNRIKMGFNSILASTDTHPKFRMWIPIPLELYVADHLYDMGFLGISFEDQSNLRPRNETFSTKSQAIIHDLQEVFNCSPNNPSQRKHTEWESSKLIVSKICELIPKALLDTEIIDLDPKQESTQTIPSLLFNELCVHNDIIMSILSSLKTISSFLSGDLSFSASYGDTLSSIHTGMLPSEWKTLLSEQHGFPQELIPALKLLRKRFSFYINILQGGTIPSDFSPLIVSKPSDLVSRVEHYFAIESNSCDVIMQATVKNTASDLTEHLDSSRLSLVFKDLYLNGAILNQQGQLFADSKVCTDVSRRTPCSLVLRFREASNLIETEQKNCCHAEVLYDCPIVLESKNNNNITIPLFSVPLDIAHYKAIVNNEADVYLSCAY